MSLYQYKTSYIPLHIDIILLLLNNISQSSFGSHTNYTLIVDMSGGFGHNISALNTTLKHKPTINSRAQTGATVHINIKKTRHNENIY